MAQMTRRQTSRTAPPDPARTRHGAAAPAREAPANATDTVLGFQASAGNQATARALSDVSVQRDFFSWVRGLFGGASETKTGGGGGATGAKDTKADGGSKATTPTEAAPTEEALPEAGPDDVWLTADPAYTKPGFVAWFRTQVEAALTPYGFTLGADAVKLKEGTLLVVKLKVVALAWDPKWGTRPTSVAIPFSMAPIRARAAVTAAHALPGWAKLSADDKGVLDNLLGGETNDLSAAARTQFEKVLPDLKTKSEDEQVAGLKALMSARPGVVAETVNTTAVGYKVGEPTVEKDYAFRGAKADAEVRVITFDDGVEVKLISPKAPTPGYHNHTVEQTALAASYVPKSARQAINTILLNANTNPDDPGWAVKYKTPDFHSYMTAGAAGVVTIYPDKDTKALPDDNYMRGTMVHETGHTWSYKTWGQDTAKGKWLDWKAAMDKDKVAVSDYATNSISEDVAETIQVYATTKGSAKFDEYKGMVPNRFGILDSEYK